MCVCVCVFVYLITYLLCHFILNRHNESFCFWVDYTIFNHFRSQARRSRGPCSSLEIQGSRVQIRLSSTDFFQDVKILSISPPGGSLS